MGPPLGQACGTGRLPAGWVGVQGGGIATRDALHWVWLGTRLENLIIPSPGHIFNFCSLSFCLCLLVSQIFKKWNSNLTVAFLEANMRAQLNVKNYLDTCTNRKDINLHFSLLLF